jgi:uncharacterized membrane protein
MSYSHILIGESLSPARPVVRRITPSDLYQALSRGVDDFMAMPSHAVFLCAIYPILGLFLIAMTLDNSLLPLAFPIAAGFALIGPVAAIGLYELSRRREAGLETTSMHAFDVRHSPSLPAILALCVVFMTIFFIWLAVAEAIYVANFGYGGPGDLQQFAHNVLFTSSGWTMIVVGTAVGFLFAVIVLAIGAISFPMLLDRDVGAAVAVATSLRVIAANPGTMALWGLIVAALLVVGSIPFFVGLTVVMPVLGHATWHLYRKAVEPDPNPRPDFKPPERTPRSAADFPAALFPTRR